MNNTETLIINEIFYSIQGESTFVGKPCVFIRLSGCDLRCSYCDTQYAYDEGEKMTLAQISEKVTAYNCKFVEITGGEPLMYNLIPLPTLLKEAGFTIYLETSGAHPLRGIFDWICLSPKQDKPPLENIFGKADELKVIIETEKDILWAEENARKVRQGCHLFLQPEWSRHRVILPVIVEYVKKHPSWRISLQTHKFMRIP